MSQSESLYGEPTASGANATGNEVTDTPVVVVLSGPSGVGKDAVLARMKALHVPFHFVVTVTTRPPRTGEANGTDYYFLRRAEFEQMLANQELLEWAEVYGHYYGVPRDQVRRALRRGQDVIIKADVQGAATIKRLVPDAVLIFLAPPSLDELARRLSERKTETPGGFARRLATAEAEMARQPAFDYVVVNYDGRLDDTVREVVEIVSIERKRKRPHNVL